jgi:hypothetical protein
MDIQGVGVSSHPLTHLARDLAQGLGVRPHHPKDHRPDHRWAIEEFVDPHTGLREVPGIDM